MSWRHVFDCSKKNYGYITAGAKAAKEAGYKYFYWNDAVYEVEGQRTNLTGKDLY
jgi:hypothetical protein